MILEIELKIHVFLAAVESAAAVASAVASWFKDPAQIFVDIAVLNSEIRVLTQSFDGQQPLDTFLLGS